MRPANISVAFLVFALAMLGGCSAPTAGTKATIDAPIASAADPQGRMKGYQPNRRYQDVVEVDGRQVQQVIEYGFDYDKRSTVKRTFDIAGHLLDETDEPSTTLRANLAEQARLIELVRTHPQLADKMREPGLHIYAGGFVLRDIGHPYCGEGSRCIRVVVSKGDGSAGHVYALVDLVNDRVVEPFHAPIQPGSQTQK